MSEVYYDAKVFGTRLKELRKTFGKTQQDIADLLSVSVDSISGYENGKTMIGHDYITVLCHYFNISADYFYFGINKPIGKEQWTDRIFSLLNGKKESEKQKAYEILKLVFQ